MTQIAVDYGRQFASFYDRIFPSGPEADQTAARLADLHLGGDTPALELGVGTGRIALPLSSLVGEVVGVDASPDMLEVLRGALKENPIPVTPVLDDIASYDEGRRYGLVYCICGTLSMLLDPADQQRAVTAAARRLAPGAALVIETHNPGGVEALHGGRPRESFFIPYPGQDAGLLSHSAIVAEHRLWQMSYIWFDDGRIRIANEVSRLTTPDEIDGYAERAGLTPVERHSDWKGGEYRADSAMQICVYRQRTG
jgi:SAM-dependent methyltransferase